LKNKKGEVSEWLKEHAWKACVGLKLTESSNLSLSARGFKPVSIFDMGFLMGKIETKIYFKKIFAVLFKALRTSFLS
jgi:hypothetical protein